MYTLIASTFEPGITEAFVLNLHSNDRGLTITAFNGSDVFPPGKQAGKTEARPQGIIPPPGAANSSVAHPTSKFNVAKVPQHGDAGMSSARTPLPAAQPAARKLCSQRVPLPPLVAACARAPHCCVPRAAAARQ